MRYKFCGLIQKCGFVYRIIDINTKGYKELQKKSIRCLLQRNSSM